MSVRRNHARRVALTAVSLETLAAGLVDGHRNAVEMAGYRLCRSSGLWRLPGGTYTARIVYKRPDTTIAYTFRGIEVGEELAP